MTDFTIEDFIDNNPNIDSKLLEESSRIKEELERLGHRKPGYRLVRRRAKFIDSREIPTDEQAFRFVRQTRASYSRNF